MKKRSGVCLKNKKGHFARQNFISANALRKFSLVGDSRRAQVWVETVIYTLIGLAIIGILLGVAKPKIDEMKDKALIEQTIDSLNKIDLKINEVRANGPGNRRILELAVSNGKFIIDSANDRIFWRLDSNYEYSESGKSIRRGNINITTTGSDPWEVELSVGYLFNLTYKGEEVLKEIDSAPSPYEMSIENLGGRGGVVQIDLRV